MYVIHICNYTKGVHILIGHHRRFPYIAIYTITWLLCAFSLVVDRDLLNDTHRWRQIHVRSRQPTCFSFFMPPKYFNKLLNFYWIKQMDYITEDVTAWIKNNSDATRLSSRVVRFCSLHAVSSSVIYYSTHTHKNVIYLLYIYVGIVWRKLNYGLPSSKILIELGLLSPLSFSVTTSVVSLCFFPLVATKTFYC